MCRIFCSTWTIITGSDDHVC